MLAYVATRFERTTDLSDEQIWPVIADIRQWAEVDRNIAWIEVDGAPEVGTRFRLKPKGGPALKFEVAAFEPPAVYADRCRLPGAVMTTRHSFSSLGELGGGTRIVVEIEVTGPLGWFWRAVAARKHAAGLPAQTDRILARAREIAAADAALQTAA